MKRNKLFWIIGLWLFSTTVQGRTVTDMAGRSVNIPETVNRVFTDRFLSLMTFALDSSLNCNATFRIPEAGRKYVSETYYANKPLTEDNEEEILRLRPDVILLSFTDGDALKTADRMQEKLRIPVLFVKFGIADYRNAYEFLGQTLNRREAAGQIIDFLDKYIIPLHEQTEKIPEKKRLSVYYAEGNFGLNTEAAGSLHSQAIDYLHLRNVAKVKANSIHGMAGVTVEQIWLWNPSAILVWSGFPSGMGLPQAAKKGKSTREYILTDQAWERVPAVRKRKVYQVPALPFGWIDRPPSVNCIAGVLWMAYLLYPDAVTFDLLTALQDYFKLFYHTEVVENDLKSLLGD